MKRVERHLLSRLLYANPVCLVSSMDLSGSRRNVMTLSWLTPIDNNAHFVCSIKTTRYTIELLFGTTLEAHVVVADDDSSVNGDSARTVACDIAPRFVLNVVTEGMEGMVVAVGGRSGRNDHTIDKLEALGITTCIPGRPQQQSDETVESEVNTNSHLKRRQKPGNHQQQLQQHPVIAITHCCAHLVCRVEERQQRGGHDLLFCVIEEGFVEEEYWDGKRFGGEPAILSFLGSQSFAAINPIKVYS